MAVVLSLKRGMLVNPSELRVDAICKMIWERSTLLLVG